MTRFLFIVENHMQFYINTSHNKRFEERHVTKRRPRAYMTLKKISALRNFFFFFFLHPTTKIKIVYKLVCQIELQEATMNTIPLCKKENLIVCNLYSSRPTTRIVHYLTTVL